jgi:hypothetical protein
LLAFLFFGRQTPLAIKKIFLLVLFTLAAFAAYSQSTSMFMGARAQALGYTTSCVKDEWALFNNIGGLSDVKNTTTSFSYHAYPLFKTFNRMAAVICIPTKIGVIGTGVFSFGDKTYNEQVLSAGFSNQFGIASLGVKVNYIQYQAEGFGSTGVFTVSMGGIATLTPQLMVGAHITNINQPKITMDDQGETVPTKLNAGLAFKPSDKVFISGEIEKDISRDAILKVGVEYQFHKKFIMRTGLNLHPDAGFVGFGFKPKRFSLDYAMGYHVVLGVNHQATISFKFGK